MTKRVLINVHNTDGIIEFAKELEKIEFAVYATMPSQDYLQANGIKVNSYNKNDDEFDVVICNFFPFKKYSGKNVDKDTIMDNFDTEGLSIIQKFSGKYEKTLVITNPNQYKTVLENLKEGNITEDTKFNFAKEAMLLICTINSEVLNILDDNRQILTNLEIKKCDLKYGENPHQRAWLYSGETIDFEQISGEPLSYNNYLDITSAVEIISEFYDVHAAIITKHAVPCAAALGTTSEDAYIKAIDCDPISAYGGIVAFSKNIDSKLAKILSSFFLEVIISPDYDEKAIEIFKEKNIKVIKLKTPLKEYKSYLTRDIVKTPFGTLVQENNKSELNQKTFKVASKKKPTTEMIEDMVFAWKIAKYARSNSAIVVKDLKTVGISQGQPNRIEAIDIALNKACENSKDAVLATDGAITMIDAIYDAAQARIAGIIQPAGSVKDKEIIASVNKYNLTMITTGLREFKNK